MSGPTTVTRAERGRAPGASPPARLFGEALQAAELAGLVRGPPPLAPSTGPSAAVEVAEAAALRAAVQALPVTIAAARLRDGAQLALRFGGALGVNLRAGPQGLELTLRPAAALAGAARAELPGLLRALGARGLRVVRAEVRAQHGAGPPGRQPR